MSPAALSGIDNSPLILPEGAFDTHVHVFDPTIGPYAPGRAYTPGDAPLDKLLAFNQTISARAGSSKIVLVQPSPYKFDCTVLLKCLQEINQGRRDRKAAYAIVVIDVDNITDQELEEMHRVGARGIRLNFKADGKAINLGQTIQLLQKAAKRISHLPGWMIQLYLPGHAWDALYESILGLPVTIIVDHLGGMLGTSKLPSEFHQVGPLHQPGFKSLLALAKTGLVNIKISGLYRASNETTTTYGDLQPIIEEFAHEVPDRLIWGSDWPHTGEGADRLSKKQDMNMKEPFRKIDNAGILKQLRSWLGSEEVWLKVFRDNAGRLYN